MENNISRFVFFTLVIIIIVLLVLNINKFIYFPHRAKPVWLSYDEGYYEKALEENFKDKVMKNFSTEKILYYLTRVKINVPVTYLKREIPLLGYYTPDILKEPSEIEYKTVVDNDEQIIKMKFDLRKPDNKEIVKENTPLESPTIFIYHTHTSETFIDDPRTQDNNGHVLPGEIGNVGQLGNELAKQLSDKYNFHIIHSTRVHDKVYSRSYYNSRKTVKEIIQKYSDINMIFDIHRDGIKNASEELISTIINGKKTARVMIVVTNGKYDFAHLNLKEHHQEWQKNLNFAHKLADRMKSMYPGLLQRIEIRDTTYNQDLHPRALLLEIGDYNNSTYEAVNAARLMAKVIASLYYHE